MTLTNALNTRKVVQISYSCGASLVMILSSSWASVLKICTIPDLKCPSLLASIIDCSFVCFPGSRYRFKTDVCTWCMAKTVMKTCQGWHELWTNKMLTSKFPVDELILYCFLVQIDLWLKFQISLLNSQHIGCSAPSGHAPDVLAEYRTSNLREIRIKFSLKASGN